jgi:nicotinamidase/pyrazinamidase
MSGVAVIAIDVQDCFLPGGSLATGNARNKNIPAKALGSNIAKFINTLAPEHVFISKDWHPAGHSSFLSEADKTQGKLNYPSAAAKGEFAKGIASGRYSGRQFVGERFWGDKESRVDHKLWPEHCVQGTPGAEVDAALMNTLSAANKAKARTILKGDTPDIDSYSVVADALGNPTPHDESGATFLSILQKSNIKTIYLTGIARDVCVFWSAMDLLNFWILPEYKKGNVIKLVFKYDLTRPVSPVPGAPYTDITAEQLTENVTKLVAAMGLGADVLPKVFAVETGGYNAVGGRRKTKRGGAKRKTRRNRK